MGVVSGVDAKKLGSNVFITHELADLHPAPCGMFWTVIVLSIAPSSFTVPAMCRLVIWVQRSAEGGSIGRILPNRNRGQLYDRTGSDGHAQGRTESRNEGYVHKGESSTGLEPVM